MFNKAVYPRCSGSLGHINTAETDADSKSTCSDHDNKTPYLAKPADFLSSAASSVVLQEVYPFSQSRLTPLALMKECSRYYAGHPLSIRLSLPPPPLPPRNNQETKEYTLVSSLTKQSLSKHCELKSHIGSTIDPYAEGKGGKCFGLMDLELSLSKEHINVQHSKKKCHGFNRPYNPSECYPEGYRELSSLAVMVLDALFGEKKTSKKDTSHPSLTPPSILEQGKIVERSQSCYMAPYFPRSLSKDAQEVDKNSHSSEDESLCAEGSLPGSSLFLSPEDFPMLSQLDYMSSE